MMKNTTVLKLTGIENNVNLYFVVVTRLDQVCSQSLYQKQTVSRAVYEKTYIFFFGFVTF